MTNPSHDYSSTFKEIFRRLQDLEVAPRVPNITNGGIKSNATASILSGIVPTLSYVSPPGSLKLPFTVSQQGSAVVIMFTRHTLETSSGMPLVWTTPAVVGQPSTDQYALTIYNTMTPYTDAGCSVAYFTGLTEGEHTAEIRTRMDATGVVLNYHFDSQSLVVIPL